MDLATEVGSLVHECMSAYNYENEVLWKESCMASVRIHMCVGGGGMLYRS